MHLVVRWLYLMLSERSYHGFLEMSITITFLESHHMSLQMHINHHRMDVKVDLEGSFALLPSRESVFCGLDTLKF